jgi:hypothetical protein
LPDPVRKDLNDHRPGLAEETEQRLAAKVRPCVAITTQRVSPDPLRRGALTRLLGARVAAPALGPLESKFGGSPYCEAEEDWQRSAFLGQIDLAQATSVLPSSASELSGLLRIDRNRNTSISTGLRVRWFPHPDASRAKQVTPASVGDWETRLVFALAWTLPEGNALEALWPLREGPAWYDYDRFFPAGYNEDGSDAFHRLLGHKSAGLDEHYGFVPPPGCSDDIDTYEPLLRLDFDNNAGFSWGSNVVYLLVPGDDLARGDLSRTVVTGANY